MTLDNDQIARELRQSIYDCTMKGLNHSAKWSAEQLIAFKTQMPDTGYPRTNNRYSDLYLYAKTLFDTREFKRCSIILEREQDSNCRFLGYYSEYLHIESLNSYRDELKTKGTIC